MGSGNVDPNKSGNRHGRSLSSERRGREELQKLKSEKCGTEEKETGALFFCPSLSTNECLPVSTGTHLGGVLSALEPGFSCGPHVCYRPRPFFKDIICYYRKKIGSRRLLRQTWPKDLDTCLANFLRRGSAGAVQESFTHARLRINDSKFIVINKF